MECDEQNVTFINLVPCQKNVKTYKNSIDTLAIQLSDY